MKKSNRSERMDEIEEKWLCGPLKYKQTGKIQRRKKLEDWSNQIENYKDPESNAIDFKNGKIQFIFKEAVLLPNGDSRTLQ